MTCAYHNTCITDSRFIHASSSEVCHPTSKRSNRLEYLSTCRRIAGFTQSTQRLQLSYEKLIHKHERIGGYGGKAPLQAILGCDSLHRDVYILLVFGFLSELAFL
ncbi:uncharacterized protein LOC143151655 [Ptiloglossa arizonensis]|uniref:uncharacterized protein LOC143151655 n=1 Tax=Ptiloglossa arizonensis TaxID=3350558 RepID=UPI003FA01285